jgi:hypothetical protein
MLRFYSTQTAWANLAIYSTDCSALQSGAIAAGWEVQTAKMQSQLGDPMAGLTETQRAQRSGQYLGAQHITSVGANGAMGAWRAIGLDLNGDGVQIVSQQSSGVVFDEDGNVGNIVYTAVGFAQSAVNDIAWEIYA